MNAFSPTSQPLWHPMTAPRETRDTPPIVVASSQGVRVTDVEGRTYLDCSAGMWNVNVGHNRPEIKAAIAAQR